MAGSEHVVLLDGSGRAAGVLPKAEAHGPCTPLHLAFSCHVVDEDGRALLTRRAPTKRTWPDTWTNACCGHPQLGETLRSSVERRVREELGLTVTRLAVALPDFTYRAEMADGTVEHERCPVVVAEVKGEARPDPSEVAELEWRAWSDLLAQVRGAPGSLSPWSEAQLTELASLGVPPGQWLASAAAERGQALLDVPIQLGARVDPTIAPTTVGRGALEAVAGPVDALLEEYLRDKVAALRALTPALDDATGEVLGLVRAGGKRLRPAFVCWGQRAAGSDDPAGLRPAAAVELLHTFALLHDDVMDRSVTRRGRPSAHVALTSEHRRAGRAGDSAWFGTSAAILVGDLAFVWADELFESAGLPADVMAGARSVFTTLREEVIAGQYLDLLLATDREADEVRAREVALLKSARYTVTRPLQLGAALAGVDVDPALHAALCAYGDAVGIAFQLRDDVLGLFGDPATTGKSRLDDLREGKRTMLVLRARRLAANGQRAALDAALGNPEVDEATGERARQVVVDTGALASIEALIRAQHGIALDAIGDVPEPAQAALVELADLAAQRCA